MFECEHKSNSAKGPQKSSFTMKYLLFPRLCQNSCSYTHNPVFPFMRLMTLGPKNESGEKGGGKRETRHDGAYEGPQTITFRVLWVADISRNDCFPVDFCLLPPPAFLSLLLVWLWGFSLSRKVICCQSKKPRSSTRPETGPKLYRFLRDRQLG